MNAFSFNQSINGSTLPPAFPHAPIVAGDDKAERPIYQRGCEHQANKLRRGPTVKRVAQQHQREVTRTLRRTVKPIGDEESQRQKIENKNVSSLEFINKQKGYEGKVAAFTTWDVFPYILNEERSKIYVNSGVDTLKFNTPEFNVLNDLQFLAPQPLDVRLDVNTYLASKAYLKTYKPKVLYIAFDETDDFAHSGMYDQYLKSAHAEDAMIADLWNTLQSMPEYKNKTTLIVACDHGRGDAIKEQWTSHGDKIADAGQIWIAAIGPDTKRTGEATNCGTLYQAQLATTFTSLFGFDFKPDHPVMKPIQQVISK